jgi:hypothetical protein
VKRREFIALLGGTAATWPLAASAQQPERVPRIGVLMASAADNPLGALVFVSWRMTIRMPLFDERVIRLFDLLERCIARDAQNFVRATPLSCGPLISPATLFFE